MTTTIQNCPRPISRTRRVGRMRDIIPADVLSSIYQHDSTYKEILSDILISDEYIVTLWNIWKQKLLGNSIFNEHIIRGKCELLLEYTFICYSIFVNNKVFGGNSEIIQPIEKFPKNITIFIKHKLFYFSEEKTNNSQAIAMFLNNDTINTHEFEITIEYSDKIFYNSRVSIYTREQYYNRYVNVEEDIHVNECCVYSNNEFYIIEKLQNMLLSSHYPII